jgi:hypothetical protein
MTDAICYELQVSLKRHLNTLWGGDLYNSSGTRTQTAFCPTALQALFTYKDANGTNRILGPSTVLVGREQEDLIDASGSTLVPSVLVEIYHHDPEEVENWRDSIYGYFDDARELDRQPLLEIGQGQRYHRRFVIKSTIYGMDADLSADEIARLGANVESFLLSILNSGFAWRWLMLDNSGQSIKDPFGEAAWRCYPLISHSRRRGGPPDDYVWDIKVYFEVATWK